MSKNSNDTGKGPGMFGRLFGRGGDATGADSSTRTEAEATTQVATDDAAQHGQVDSSADMAAEATSEPAKQGWFKRLTSGLAKTSSRLTEGITSVFTKSKLEASDLDDLEDLLIQADLGVDTAMRITERISSGRYEKGISPDQVREILAGEVESVLAPVARELEVGSKWKAACHPHGRRQRDRQDDDDW